MMLLIAALLVLAGGSELLAQDAWPAYSSGNPDPHYIARGPGFYFAIWKIVLLLVVIWAWVKSVSTWWGGAPSRPTT